MPFFAIATRSPPPNRNLPLVYLDAKKPIELGPNRGIEKDIISLVGPLRVGGSIQLHLTIPLGRDKDRAGDRL